MSSLACPAASSIRGTAEISRAPAETRRLTHSETGGRESSMKPPSIRRSGSLSRTRDKSSWNSSAPRGSRVPWPTIRSAGSPPLLLFPFAASGRSLTSFLLEVQKGIERRRRDRRSPLGTAVRHRRQPALDQLLLGLGRAYEPDRQPDHERRFHIQFHELGERRRCVPDDSDGPGTHFRRRDPEPRGGARYAESFGEIPRAGVGDEAEDLAGRDARGDHPDVRDDGSSPAQGFEAISQGRLVEGEGLGVFEICGGVDHTLGHGAGERREVRKVHELAQYAVALGLYRVRASHSLSALTTSTHAATGQTSAHSAHPVQRSSRTTRGEERSL